MVNSRFASAGLGAMRLLRILCLGILVAEPLCAPAEAARIGVHGPVAIVYSLAGEASLAAPDGAIRLLCLFDRLPAGAIVEVGPGSRLALAFVNGLRYQLDERSSATLGPSDLSIRSGPVRPLPSVPPLPRLLPIAEEDDPGLRAGAVRIRGERITGLYPHGGAAALVGETVLRFRPVAGARGYRIEIRDRQGRTVFQTETESAPVKVPAGTLRPGLDYQWVVRTLDRPGAIARGEAKIVTLSQHAAQAREEARKVLEAEGPDSLPLLAEIDRSLGLLLEARKELQTALLEKPGDPALRRALAEIEARLVDENDPDS